MASNPMPALFIGHGNPMNALELNDTTRRWREVASCLPRPRAILSVSAHWFVNISAVTSMPRPRTIHDFYGFPKELFDVTYDAPGDPALALEVAEVAKPDYVGQDADSWGLDHGTWSVLVHLFPDADVPVVQLSIHADEPIEYHLALGARLERLRHEGVLVVASGNVVHNLRLVEFDKPGVGSPEAHRFDVAARERMLEDPGSLASLRELREYGYAVPTPDHFLPLAYLAGMAAASGEQVRTVLEGCEYGSLSMTAYSLGLN